MSAVSATASLEWLTLMRATFGVANFGHFRDSLTIPLANVMYIHALYCTKQLFKFKQVFSKIFDPALNIKLDLLLLI